MTENKTTAMYQKCPICNGYGYQDPHRQICSVCNGMKIISTLTGKPPIDDRPESDSNLKLRQAMFESLEKK